MTLGAPPGKRVASAKAFVYESAAFAGMAKAAVAQLVEQRIRNAWVGGSSPFRGTTCRIAHCTFEGLRSISLGFARARPMPQGDRHNIPDFAQAADHHCGTSCHAFSWLSRVNRKYYDR